MQKELWNSLLDADMNARYWGKYSRRFARLDTNSKIFLAILSSGSVAGWQFWSQYPILWKALSAASAIVSVTLPIIKLPKMIGKMSDLSGKWIQIRADYELLWTDFNLNNNNTKQIQKRYADIKKREVTAKKIESELPESKKLIYASFLEVHTSRGLEVKSTNKKGN